MAFGNRLINAGGFIPPILGDFIEGGIVYYINPSDPTQGMVMSLSYVGSTYTWWNGSYAYVSNAISLSIGDDYVNTTNIINALGSGTYAASVARGYNYGGYNDWSLPTRNSLTAIYQNKTLLSNSAVSNGGEALRVLSLASRHWSSSDVNSTSAWRVYFSNGSFNYVVINDDHAVRPVRPFQL